MPIPALIPVRVVDEDGEEVEPSNYDFVDDETGDYFDWPVELVVRVRLDGAAARVIAVYTRP